MEIVTPDRAHSMLVTESSYFADPTWKVEQIRHQLRQLGYPT